MNEHFTRYSRRTFRQVAQQAGLGIQTERYFFQWLFPLKLATRVLERAMGLQPRPAGVPPRWINAPLYLLSRLEQNTWGALPWPFGSSLMVWGRKSNRWGLGRLRKNRQSCHPEESPRRPVLSETKEGPLYLPDSKNAEVLRGVYPERAERDPSLRSG
jgi:hypothetical protein